MNPSHDTELQQSEAVTQLIGCEPASGAKEEGIGNNNVARIAILAIVAISILIIPLVTFLSSRAHLVPKRPIFVGARARQVNPDSAVLAVDTFGLNIQARTNSASTREVLEQVAIEHLARLHRTYSRWADTNGDLMGSLLLKVKVDATGKVVDVASLASHVTNTSFTNTVLDDVRKWKFPKAGVEVAEITVPLLFVPKGMDPETVVQWERKVRSGQEGETPAGDLRSASKAPISTAGEGVPSVLSAVPPGIQPSTSKAPKTHIVKPKTEQVLIAVRTNRSVAIRDNPNFAARKIHEVDVDTELSIVENRGDWLKVKIADAGFIGFVRKEFVSPVN
jgi:hypothetical protein